MRIEELLVETRPNEIRLGPLDVSLGEADHLALDALRYIYDKIPEGHFHDVYEILSNMAWWNTTFGILALGHENRDPDASLPPDGA